MNEPTDIIGMKDMLALFSVTDAFGIDRESISVPLGKIDPGGLERTAQGDLEITVPQSEPLPAFLERLRGRLMELGYVAEEEEEDGLG